ncbi:MAG: NAD-dependent epimerase/dehydratase family protein, partial [Burkholderiaceae bacterium]
MNKILVIGGAGFVGRHIVARLAGGGLRVTVPTRHRARARHLIMLPTVEVVEMVLSGLINKDIVT